MIDHILTFFGILGLDIVPPATMGELVPYLLTVTVGLVLAEMVFRVIVDIARVFAGHWWRK